MDSHVWLWSPLSHTDFTCATESATDRNRIQKPSELFPLYPIFASSGQGACSVSVSGSCNQRFHPKWCAITFEARDSSSDNEACYLSSLRLQSGYRFSLPVRHGSCSIKNHQHSQQALIYANVGTTIFRRNHKVWAGARPWKIHREASEVLFLAKDGGPCCSILHTLLWNSTRNWQMKVHPCETQARKEHIPDRCWGSYDYEIWAQLSVLIFHHVFIPKYQIS